MVKGLSRENFAVALTIRQHSVTSGVMPELGGKDEGANPHELLEAALAACTSMTIKMYALRKKWPLQNVEVSARIDREGIDPKMTCEIKLVGDLSTEQRQRLTEIAAKCPIHKLLTQSVKIELQPFT